MHKFLYLAETPERVWRAGGFIFTLFNEKKNHFIIGKKKIKRNVKLPGMASSEDTLQTACHIHINDERKCRWVSSRHKERLR